MEKHYYSKSVEQKQKFIFFPFWNVERVEKILCEQERNGYRFVRLRLGCLFTFQKSTPREVQYVLIYSFPKEHQPVLEWETTLKSDAYRANVMHQGHNYGIFRITKNNVNLQNFYIDMLQYVKRILIQKTVIATFMMLVGAFTTLVGDFSAIGRLFTLFIFLGGLLELLSYIIGFCKIAKKKKKLIQKHE